MKKIRFVVLGDTHFCTKEIRGELKEKYSLATLPDHARYSSMVHSILEPMFELVKSLNPDFVISTGDFVEGGMSYDKDKTYAEMEQGWDFMKKLGAPCFIAKGTHEGSGSSVGAQAYREIVLPGMSELSGETIDNEYFRFDRGDASFFMLDYLDYDIGGAQEKWLEDGLKEASEANKAIFIAAHPPLYNWGRHFFNEAEFINRIIELCNKYPVAAYLCGHTHNQALSFHETQNGRGFVQIMGSSVGFEHMDLVALTEFHALADFTEKDHFYWGLVEDSSPGFHLVEIDESGAMKIEWNSFNGDKAFAAFESPGAEPAKVEPPLYRKRDKVLSDDDALMAKSAGLYIFGLYGDCAGTRVCFNGVDLGELPTSVSYAARRYILLTPEALKTIGRKNTVNIKLPSAGDFVLGSVSFELFLWDDRIIRSNVAPEIFVCGERWKEFPQPRKVENVSPGEEVSLDISFD